MAGKDLVENPPVDNFHVHVYILEENVENGSESNFKI